MLISLNSLHSHSSVKLPWPPICAQVKLPASMDLNAILVSLWWIGVPIEAARTLDRSYRAFWSGRSRSKALGFRISSVSIGPARVWPASGCILIAVRLLTSRELGRPLRFVTIAASMLRGMISGRVQVVLMILIFLKSGDWKKMRYCFASRVPSYCSVC